MARCSKKTVGGGGCQTCNGSQAKGPAAILIFEAKKKAKRSADGKARRQGESRGKQANNHNPEHNQEKQRQEKGEGNGRKKQKERDNQEGRKRGPKETKRRSNKAKNKGKPPQGKAHRPQANPPKRPTTKPPDTRTPKGGTRGKGLMRLDANASGPTSLEVCAGHVRTATKQLRAVKTCVRKGHLLLPKIKQSRPHWSTTRRQTGKPHAIPGGGGIAAKKGGGEGGPKRSP